MAGLDFVELLTLLLQLSLELILFQLHSTSFGSRPADSAFQLHDSRLQGHLGVRANVKPSLETRPPELPQQRHQDPKQALHTWCVPKAQLFKSAVWKLQSFSRKTVLEVKEFTSMSVCLPRITTTSLTGIL